MADREAKLKIAVELIEAGKVGEGLAVLRKEMESGGAAATKASASLTEAAAATEKLDAAQAGAASTGAREVAVLEAVGTVALEAGEMASQGAQETAAALEGASAAAQEEVAALANLGATAAESGAEATAAAEKVTAAELETAEAAKKVTSELDRSGDEGRRAAGEIAAAFEKAGADVRASGLALEVQRTALAAIISEADKLTAAYIKQGAEGKEGANATATAMLTLKAKLADVNAEISEEIERIRNLPPALDDATTAASRFDEIATIAMERVQAAEKTLNDELRITPRQLGVTVQAVESLKIEMLEMADQGIVATGEQIAKYQMLEGEVLNLTLRANQLTNAVSDNAGRLKETGAQVQGVAFGVQQLTSALGPNAAKVGMLIGNVGQLGGAYEGMKDAVHAMDLNTISATASMAKMGVQAGAVAAAAVAGAAAGTALARANQENKKVIDDFVKSLKELKDSALAGAIDRVGAMQSALQKMIASLGSGEVDDLRQDTIGLGIAMEQGADAAKVYYQLINDGWNDVAAMKAVTQEAEEAAQLYRLAHEQGARSVMLWNEAVANAGKTGQGLARELALLKIQLEEEGGTLAALAEQKKQDADRTREQTQRTEENTAALRENQLAQRDAQDSAVRASVDALLYERAVNGSSEAVNILTRTIRDMIGASDENSVALAREAAELQAKLDKLDGLGASQRARIQEIIDLAKKGNELTETDRLYVEQLTRIVESGNKAAASTALRKKATEDLSDAIRELSESERLEIAAEEARIATIGRELALVREAIEEAERRQGISREQTEINLDQGASLDYLRMKEAQLTREMEPQITIARASAAAKAEDTDARAKLVAIIDAEKASADATRGAHRELNTVIENGRTVVTNLTDAHGAFVAKGVEVVATSDKIKLSADEAAEKVRGAAVAFGDLSTRFDDAIGAGGRLETMLIRVNDALEKLNTAAANAATQ